MGDRYHIKIKCAYCGKLNPKPKKNNESWMDDFIYYAESCGFTTFDCDYCGKKNKIEMNFKAVKIKENN